MVVPTSYSIFSPCNYTYMNLYFYLICLLNYFCLPLVEWARLRQEACCLFGGSLNKTRQNRNPACILLPLCSRPSSPFDVSYSFALSSLLTDLWDPLSYLYFCSSLLTGLPASIQPGSPLFSTLLLKWCFWARNLSTPLPRLDLSLMPQAINVTFNVPVWTGLGWSPSSIPSITHPSATQQPQICILISLRGSWSHLSYGFLTDNSLCLELPLMSGFCLSDLFSVKALCHRSVSG